MKKRIAGKDERMSRRFVRERGSAMAADAVMDQHRQIRSKAGGFLLPVADDRGRADQQHRPAAVLIVLTLNERERLDGLAESHVIGEARAESPSFQKLQPLQTRSLEPPHNLAH